jgi:hypothetical protein
MTQPQIIEFQGGWNPCMSMFNKYPLIYNIVPYPQPSMGGRNGEVPHINIMSSYSGYHSQNLNHGGRIRHTST